MPYLIDGNNVMHGFHSDRESAKKGLLDSLAKFIAVNRVKLTVVFDGVPDDLYPEGIKVKSVRVLYARIGSDADSRIKDLVRKSSYKRDIIVVTSDKPLASYVSSLGSSVVNSYRFRGMLAESEKEADRFRTSHINVVDVDEWLDYFEAGSQKAADQP